MTPNIIILATILGVAPLAAAAAETGVTHIPVAPRPGVTTAPAYSGAVRAGDTVYLSGTTDGGAALGGTPADAARRAMDNLKRTAESAGVTLDDLVWVQVFSADLADYAAFNEVYRTYFKGPLHTRAFLGVDHLLGNARFEVMGIAVRKAK